MCESMDVFNNYETLGACKGLLDSLQNKLGSLHIDINLLGYSSPKLVEQLKGIDTLLSESISGNIKVGGK